MSSAWYGDVPDGWESVALRYLAESTTGGTPSKSNSEFWGGDIPWVSPKDMKSSEIEDAEQHTTKEAVEQSSTTLVPDNSLLVVARSGILKHSIPVGVTTAPVAINQDIRAYTLRNNSISAKFLQLFITSHQNALLNLWRKQGATVQSLDSNAMAETRFPRPPIEEQQAVADFLNRRTACIDALVTRKRQLISFLREKRQALITEAVTTGFEGESLKEETDIPWLEKLPTNWKTAPVRFSCQRVTSGPRDWAEYHSEEGDIFLRVTNLRTDHIEMNLEDIQRVNAPNNKEANRAKVQTGDILVAITGATICSVGVVPETIEKAYINQHTALVRPTDKIESRWLAYCLFSTIGQEQLQIPIRGGTKQGLGLGDIKQVQLPLPSIREQRELVKKVDTMINRTDELTERLKQSVEVFQEKRQALITAAVTGQIDVTEGRGEIQDQSV